MADGSVVPSAKDDSDRFQRSLGHLPAQIHDNLSHKKLMELANAAGAIYRMDGIVLINRDIFDEYLERFHETKDAFPMEEEEDKYAQ